MWLPATEQREDRDAGRKTTRGAAVQPPRERAFKGRGAQIDTAVAVEEGQGAGSEVDALPG